MEAKREASRSAERKGVCVVMGEEGSDSEGCSASCVSFGVFCCDCAG